MAIRACTITVRPDKDDYIATTRGKKYRCHSIRGCFKAANGRWPKNRAEIEKFIDLVVHKGVKT